METPERFQAGPRDFLAAERTFLAWIRTGVSLMALGFVLARFGLFLREFNLMRPDVHTASYGFSLWFGTVLILLGVLVCLLALVRYLRLLTMMRRGERSFGQVSALAVAVAVLLAVLGLAMSYYLVSARHVSALHLFDRLEAPMHAIPENGAQGSRLLVGESDFRRLEHNERPGRFPHSGENEGCGGGSGVLA